MKKGLVDLLACPICKGRLELEIAEEEEGEIVIGSLTCFACSHSYPIEEGVPNLLPPEPPREFPR